MDLMRFLPVAKAMSQLSKDPRTKVACLAIDDDGNVLSTGWNSFPRGVDDNPARYADRKVKLRFTAHAESNCIAQAARNGIRLMGSTLLLTSLYPCSNCAKQIIQAGIRRVYAPKMESHHSPEWFEEKSISELMFRESGIELIEYGEV